MLTTEQFINQLEQNFRDCIAIARAKNNDYSKPTDPFANFKECEKCGVTVEQGIYTRLSDKFNRLGNLLNPNHSRKVKDETVLDTTSDCINYLNILMVYLQAKKENNDK